MPNQPNPEIYRTSYREFKDTFGAIETLAKHLRSTVTGIQKNAVSEYVEHWERGRIPKDDLPYVDTDGADSSLTCVKSLRIWKEDLAAIIRMEKETRIPRSALYRAATARYTRRLLDRLRKVTALREIKR